MAHETTNSEGASTSGEVEPVTRRRAPEPVLKVATLVTPKVLPVLPDTVKRLLAGGRAVVIDGNTLDPTLQAFLAGLRLSGVTGLIVDGDVTRSRRQMSQTCRALGGPALPVEVGELSVPGPAGPVGIRRYLPPGPAAGALVFFHGGGYVLGDLDSYDAVCRRICQDAGIQVFSVDYRLAPEHPAPAAVEDSLAAYRWIAAHAGELRVPADRIAVGGDSAGGGLAAAVSQLTRDDDVPPALQVLAYPWTDLRAPSRSRTLFASGFLLSRHDLAFCGDRYLEGSGVAADDPRVSPGRAADLSGLPPALVITAGFDPLRDEGDRYAEAMAAAGVRVDVRREGGLIHGFLNMAGLGGDAERAVDEVVSALRAHLSRGRGG